MSHKRNPDLFLETSGWANAACVVVAGDASNRRYARLTKDDGQTAILMDAPPDKGEDVTPFITITKLLRDQGLSAPAILGDDTENGFLLLEDLGDALFARVIEQTPEVEETLYRAATDALIHLHQAPTPDLPAYDAATMTPLAALAFDWYGAGALDRPQTEVAAAFSDACQTALEPLDRDLTVLIQRDYHAENLLWLPKRDGVAKVGLLDYQDAMRGHPSYDLVSVLQDARRDVSPDVAARMVDHYVSSTGVDRAAFKTAYALMGMQRNMRILGVFARLSMAYGKPHYVDLIPRVWAHLLTNLSDPALTAVAPLITDTLPAPTPDILKRLKSLSGSVPL